MRYLRWVVVGSLALGLLAWSWLSVPRRQEGMARPTSGVTQLGEFNRANVPAAPSQVIDREIGVDLLGTALHRPASGGTLERRAFLEDLTTRLVGSYRLLDTINGWVLTDISLGTVTLLKDGRKVRLSVDNARKRRPVIELSPTERLIQRSLLAKEAENINLLWQKLAVIPHLEEGRIRGFQVTGLDAKGLLKTLCIQKGDIVEEVNGQPLGSFKEAARIAQVIRQEVHRHPVVTVTLERGESPCTLTYFLY